MAIKAYHLVCALTTGLAASAAFSGAMGDANTSFSYRPHIALQVGSAWSSMGKSQSVSINKIDGDEYFSVTRGTDVNVLAGLGLYWDAYTNSHATFSYGINAFYLANNSAEGEVSLLGLEPNLGYKYSVSNWPIYFGARAVTNDLFAFTDKAGFTFDVGVGPNIIQAHSFREYSLYENEEKPEHLFKEHTKTTFTAMAGAGIKLNSKLLGNSSSLECGYRFYYLGNGHFNTTTPQVYNKLDTGDSYANALVCSVIV